MSDERSDVDNCPPDEDGEGWYEVSLNSGEVRLIEVPIEMVDDFPEDSVPAHYELEVQLKHSIDQWAYLGYDEYRRAWDRWANRKPRSPFSLHQAQKDWSSMPQPKDFYNPNGFRVHATYAVTFVWYSAAEPDSALIASARDRARPIAWPYFRQLVLGFCQARGMDPVDIQVEFPASSVPLDFYSQSEEYQRYLADPSSVGPAPPVVSRHKRTGKRS